MAQIALLRQLLHEAAQAGACGRQIRAAEYKPDVH